MQRFYPVSFPILRLRLVLGTPPKGFSNVYRVKGQYIKVVFQDVFVEKTKAQVVGKVSSSFEVDYLELVDFVLMDRGVLLSDPFAVYCDASNMGLEEVLMQEGNMVAYASSYHSCKADVVVDALSWKPLHMSALMVRELDLIEQFRYLSLVYKEKIEVKKENPQNGHRSNVNENPNDDCLEFAWLHPLPLPNDSFVPWKTTLNKVAQTYTSSKMLQVWKTNTDELAKVHKVNAMGRVGNLETCKNLSVPRF
ncbi:hypothetical protein CR513_03822, partial [Mucuna pruriens]